MGLHNSETVAECERVVGLGRGRGRSNKNKSPPRMQLMGSIRVKSVFIQLRIIQIDVISDSHRFKRPFNHASVCEEPLYHCDSSGTFFRVANGRIQVTEIISEKRVDGLTAST